MAAADLIFCRLNANFVDYSIAKNTELQRVITAKNLRAKPLMELLALKKIQAQTKNFFAHILNVLPTNM